MLSFVCFLAIFLSSLMGKLIRSKNKRDRTKTPSLLLHNGTLCYNGTKVLWSEANRLDWTILMFRARAEKGNPERVKHNIIAQIQTMTDLGTAVSRKSQWWYKYAQCASCSLAFFLLHLQHFTPPNKPTPYQHCKDDSPYPGHRDPDQGRHRDPQGREQALPRSPALGRPQA